MVEYLRSTFVIVVHLFLDFLTIEKEFQYRKGKIWPSIYGKNYLM